MRVFPRFTVHSERPAWLQVARAVAFFCLASILVVGSVTTAAWGKDAWDRHQDARAEHAAMAALGLRRICEGNMVASCLQRAADAANVSVVTAPSSFADLLVSTGRRHNGPVGLAPIPPRAAEVRYAAFEQVFVPTVGTESEFDLVTAPTSRPDRSRGRAGSISVDGIRVDLWMTRAVSCRCAPKVRDVWAEWHHDGHVYAAWFILWANQGPPANVLRELLPTLRYTEPASQS